MARQPQTGFVAVNGIKLAYNDWPGDRGPLICIPSITGHKGTFTTLAERLSPEYRALALDLRGRCDSDKPADGYGFAYHARDIMAFVDTLRIERFILVGHSFGATASVYTASLHPDRVKALVLMDGGADPKAETLKAMYPTIKRLAKVYSSMDEYLAVQRNVVYHKPWTPALERYFKEDVETLENGSVRSKSSAVGIEQDMDLHNWDNVWFHLPHVRCPVLYLRPTEGLLDSTGHVHGDEEASRLAGLLSDCRYEPVASGNHYTFLIQDNPPVLPFVEKFLKEAAMESPVAKPS